MTESNPSYRYRNTLLDVVGAALNKAKREGEAELADALLRWQASAEFAKDASRQSLSAYTAGMSEPVRRKFHDIVTHARGVAEAASRTSHIS